jgi:type II secretory pathway component GspD/PulD (secretin)
MGNRNMKIASISVLILMVFALLLPQDLPAKTNVNHEVTFNFVDVDLPVITKFVSEITHKNFILDERVKGKITIMAPVKLSVDDTFNLFAAVLEMKGFTVIPSGVNAYSIIPASEAKQKGIKFGIKVEELVNASYAAELLPLKYVSAADVVKLVQPIVSKDGYVAVFGPGNFLLVVDSGNNRENIRSIINAIDKPLDAKRLANIYFLENADATELAKVLDGVIRTSQTAQAQAQKQGSTGSAFEAVSGITVTADRASNALIIVASPSDYQSILATIKDLDKRRRQVFVQAVIAEVSLDKLKDLGTQLTVSGGGTAGNVSAAGGFDPFGFLGSSTSLPSPQQAAIVGALTALTGNTKIGANIHALLSNSAVNVLSTPTIMTSDNKEAEIFVGENVPFVTSVTATTVTTLPQQSIERKDTGIILRITPQITEGDYLKLDIYQEISAVKDALSKGAAADITTTKRSAKTSVVVKDKDTVVIGGLIQDRDEIIINKVPLLGDIPLLGWLFKTKSTHLAKINLLITLTPHIIKSVQDMTEISGQQKSKFEQESVSDESINLDKKLRPSP